MWQDVDSHEYLHRRILTFWLVHNGIPLVRIEVEAGKFGEWRGRVYQYQGCQYSAFRRNFAFFFTFRFLKNYFPLFLKNRKQKFFFRVPTPPLSIVRRASVNSQWRLGLLVCASSVSGRSSKAPYLHSALKIWHPQPCCVLAYSVDCLDEGEGRVIIQLKHLRPLPFLSHHFTHTHTHTDIHWFRAASCYDFAVACHDFAVACHGQSLHATLTPKMLRSLIFRRNSVGFFPGLPLF